METPLSQDENLVPAAVDTLPINFAILNDAGVILWTNKAWRDFGVENDIDMRPETIGVNYLDVTTSSDDEFARQAADGIDAILTGHQQEFELEYPCHSPDEQRWFLMRAAGFSVDGDRFASVAHIDITDRVLNEQASERYKLLFEAAGQVLILTDTDGTIKEVNPVFEKVTGYSAGEVIGKNPRILQSGEHDEAFYEEMWDTILAGETWNDSIINRRKGGDLYFAYATIEPVIGRDGEIKEFIALQTEVTDLYATKQQLRALDDVLRHSLRNELTVLLGHVEMLARADGVNREPAEEIIESVERLVSTADKTKQLRRIFEQTVEPTRIDIADLVRRVASAKRDEFPAAEISVDAPESLNAMGFDALELAVGELIENAVVHNETDSPLVEIALVEVDGQVEVSVADNGPGIPEIEHEQLGVQQRTSQLSHPQGMGLQLAYWITRRAGGNLHVSENTPQGSVVTLELYDGEGK